MADSLDMLIAKGPPTVDFSIIGNLPQTYAEGVKNQAAVDAIKALQGGIPTDANGNPDYGALANLAAKTGDLGSAAKFATLGSQLKTRAAIPQYLSSVFGGGSSSAAPASAPSNPLTGDYFSKVAQTESGGNPNAVNPTTGASGSNQFLQSTWLDLMKRHPELGLTPQGIFDAGQQKKAMQAFTSDNFDYLSANGVNPTDQNLYLAHFAGPEGAVRFLQGAESNPNAPAASLFGPAAVKANQSLFFGKDGRPVSAGEFYTNLTGRFSTGSQAPSVAAPAQPNAGQGGGMAGMDPMRLFQAGVMLSSIPGGEETGKALIQFASTLQGQNKPTFGQIGEDQFGNKRFGFVNPSTQSIKPVEAPGSAGNAVASDLHGQDFLATLDSGTADQVKALAEGRMQFPTGAGLRSPRAQMLLRMVSQYDPSFDAVNYGSRYATRKDFTSGKSAQSINAMNTVLGHLQSLSDAADRLNNGRFPMLNAMENSVLGNMGDPRFKQFDATKKAVVDELTRVWRGNGGSEGDIKTWSDAINAAGSPAQLHGVIGQIGELIESKINSLGQTYTQGMGTTSQPLQLVGPKAQSVLTTLRKRAGLPVENNPDSVPGQTAPATPAPAAPPKVKSTIEANAAVQAARQAIANGKDRNAVIQTLQQMGVPVTGL